MGEQSGASGMDRVERMMEMLIADHVTMQELAESQKHTDERMGVLVHMVDEFMRGRDKT